MSQGLTMDEVNIEIESSAEKAVSGIDALIASLDKLQGSLSNSLRGLKDFSVNLSGMVGNVSNISKAIPQVEQTSKAIRDIAQATEEVKPIDIGSNGNLVQQELQVLNTQQQVTTSTDKMKDALVEYYSEGGRYDQFESKLSVIQSKMDGTAASSSRLSNVLSGIRVAGSMAFEGIKAGAEKVTNTVSKITTAVGKVKSALSKIKDKITGAFDNKGIDKGLKKILKYTLALFSIRGTYALLNTMANHWLNSSNEKAKELSANIDYLKYSMGSALSPVIETLVNLFTKMVKLIQQVAYAFSGVNIFANATASSMSSASSSANKLKKQLAGFDELNVIDFGNDSSSGSATPSIDLTQMEDVQSTLLDKIKVGDWYGLGMEIGAKINEALSSIPWDKIKKTAGQIGKDLADLFNGLTDGIDWNKVGDSIAQGLNTAITFASEFINTFNFDNFGYSISTGFISSIANIDWGQLASTTSKGIEGLLDAFAGWIRAWDWKVIAQAILDFVSNIDWKGIADSVFNLLGTALGNLVNLGSVIGDLISKAFDGIEQYFQDKIEECGGNVVLGILKGILDGILSIGQWIYEHIFTPFINGFKSAFEIHSPSKVMAKLGGFIIDGLKEGLIGIWDKVKEIFTKLKDKIVEVVISIKDFITEKFTEIKNNIAEKISNIKQKFIDFKNGVQEIPESIKEKFVNKFEEIKNGITEKIDTIKQKFTDFKDAITSIPQKIKDAFSNLDIKIKTPHFSWTSKPATGWIADTLSALGLPTSLPKLSVDWYAEGGFPDEGQLFVANEAGPEMVGNIGNKAAVANNDQITKAIAQATYQAMSQAMNESSSSGSRKIIVNVGNKKLYEGYGEYANSANNKYGTNVIKV